MRTVALIAFLFALCVAGNAQAHFKLNQNVRIHHVVHNPEGVDVFLRTPMSFLVAGLVGTIGPSGLPEPAPFTTNATENGTLMHFVDPQALDNDPEGLGRIAAEALNLRVKADVLQPAVLSVRVHPIGREPAFATRQEAEAALALGSVFPGDAGPTYVGDAMVDVHIHYGDGPIGNYTIANSLDPGLPDQEATANLILDYRNGETRTYRATGLLQDPVVVKNSATNAAMTFVVEGIRHILEGLDHVLFVLCMIIGAHGLRNLLGRVTGFTVGHTITLILGFFGLAPSGDWFIPTVELAIALSIIYAAVTAMLYSENRRGDDLHALAITSAIGLLHGFGFSFMLRNILQVDAPNLWQSLLAFNIGVELGQLAIVAVTWPIVLALRSMPQFVWVGSRAFVALSASAIAIIWTVERASWLL